MRVIWVSLHAPGAGGGADGAEEQALLDATLDRHEVHVVCAALPPGEISVELSRRTTTAEGINWWLRRRLPVYPRNPLTKAIATVRPGPPIDVWATRNRNRSVREATRRAVARREADAVVIAAPELAQVVGVAAVPAGLLVSETLTGRYQRRAQASAGNPLGRFKRQLEARRARRWERQWLHRSAAVGCVGGSGCADVRDLAACDVRKVADGASLSSWLEDFAARPAPDERAPAPAPPNADDLTATLVVCTRERPAMLESVLPSLRDAAARAPAAEILIVEQGRPFAHELCRRLGIEATIVPDPGAGASRARNIGAASASGDVVLFTDDDCRVPGSWVVDHLDALRTHDAAASCGLVRGISRLVQDDLPDAVSWSASHHAGSPPWAIGHSSNMAIRAAWMRSIGGFDERFGPGAPGSFICEDADLIVRVLRGGGTVRSGVGGPVDHLDWRSSGENIRNVGAYERGAGAWIGKLLREDRGDGIYYLRERMALLGNRVRDEPGIKEAPIAVVGTLAEFARGLTFGLRLSAWPVDERSK